MPSDDTTSGYFWIEDPYIRGIVAKTTENAIETIRGMSGRQHGMVPLKDVLGQVEDLVEELITRLANAGALVVPSPPDSEA
jgi:hypothetical protein